MDKKVVKNTHVIMHELVLPNDTNLLGNVLGGRVMHLMDMCAAMSAYKHARTAVVTASVDQLDFLAPAKQGDIMMLKSAGLRPVSFITCRIPENIAFSGASGVVATLMVSRVGPLSTTMSVNVPPISMASRASAIKLPLV